MKELDKNTVESSELVEQTFNFWLNDQNHIRSPFPDYIHRELRYLATERFYTWAQNLNVNAKDELNEEMIVEKFEEVIFDTARDLVKTEDERITVMYPFLPRLGDRVEDSNKGDSVVAGRTIVKEGDTSFLQLIMKLINSNEQWETKIELPI